MTPNKLLILGIGNVALKYLEEALAPHGLEPVVMGDRQSLPAETWATYSPARFHDVLLEAHAVIRYLSHHPDLCQQIRAVTTLFDEQLPLVEAVALEYGWAYPGYAVVRLSDKATVAAHAQALSPPSYPFDACEPERLGELADQPCDWIVKPACCSGGEAVGGVSGGQGLIGRIRVHLARHFHIRAERWLLQKRLEGTLVSFEGYMKAGTLHRMGVSRRPRMGLTEVANRFPADTCLSPAQLTAGWEGLANLFTRADYRNGWFHCECIAGRAGLHLIDANAGRIGGATVLEQMALAAGMLPAELLAHVLLLPLRGFHPHLPAWHGPFTDTLGVWYGLPEAAVLTGMELGPHRARHTRFARDGAVVPPIGTSDYAWVGMLSGQETDVLGALRGLRLLTDRGTLTPAYSLD